MRLGVRTRSGWWVSMGFWGWLFFGWIYICVLVGVGIGWLVYQLLRFLFLTLRELVLLLGSLVRRAS